ncbi:MAG: hypothetical protein KC609_24185, partial [Myxococcales bacterium]|nr:hypothetical protein [Myxococcales bacterium]
IAAFLKGTELEAIEFDSQDAFTPSPLQTFGADPLTLWIDHDRDGVLSALPSGPLTWSDANGVISLSDKPLSGDLSGLQLTADRSLLVFLGRLDGDHPGLYLTDYATPGKDSTRRLSPNIAGCSNGCDAKLVQLFSDGEGVVFVQGIDPQQSISRAFRIRFADLPADGPPGDALVPLGFGGVGSTAYTQPGQSVQTLSLGGDRFIGLYGNPLSPGDYQIDVVDRTSNESFTFISYGLASVLETESFRPRWSDDGSYMGVPLSDSTDAVRIFDVDAMISGLKNGAP